MVSKTLASRIEEALEQQAGIMAVAEEQAGRIILSGTVSSPEQKQAAEDIVATLVSGMTIDNDLEVESVVPTPTTSFYTGGASSAALPDSVEEIRLEDAGIDPDFSEARSSNTTLDWSGVDPDEEEDTVYIPPTDPVITTDAQDNVRVLNGFASTSMDSVEVAPSASDDRLGDEAIRDAILRELREDAATTDLDVDVRVVNGIVHLRGAVADMTDAESAQEVAARVPGVEEVVDELHVATI